MHETWKDWVKAKQMQPRLRTWVSFLNLEDACQKFCKERIKVECKPFQTFSLAQFARWPHILHSKCPKHLSDCLCLDTTYNRLYIRAGTEIVLQLWEIDRFGVWKSANQQIEQGRGCQISLSKMKFVGFRIQSWDMGFEISYLHTIQKHSLVLSNVSL